MISKKDKLIKGASLVLLILFFFSLDQISKNYFLGSGYYVFKNFGVAFGLFPWFLLARFVYFLLTTLAVAWVLRQSRNLQSAPTTIASALFLSGVLGNWFDFFSRGFVVDWLKLQWLLPFWPEAWASYFNLADVWIFLGITIFASGTRTIERPDSGSRG